MNIRDVDPILNLIVNGTRIAVVVFWVAFVLSLVSVIPSPYGLFAICIGVVVLLIHLAEYLYVKNRFAGRDTGQISFVKTMIFGFTHLLPLLTDEREKR